MTREMIGSCSPRHQPGCGPPLRLDWTPAAARPRLADYVELKRFSARGGRDYAMLANTNDLVYYRLEPAEAAILPLLDGTRTVGEVLVAHLQESGALDFTTVADFVGALREGGFLTEDFVDTDAAVRRALARRGPRARLSKFIRTLTVEWSGAEPLTVWLYRHGLKFLFNKIGALVATLVVIAGTIAFARRRCRATTTSSCRRSPPASACSCSSR